MMPGKILKLILARLGLYAAHFSVAHCLVLEGPLSLLLDSYRRSCYFFKISFIPTVCISSGSLSNIVEDAQKAATKELGKKLASNVSSFLTGYQSLFFLIKQCHS